jgi:hypothetical protein
MKKKVFLLLFLAVTSVLNSQQNNKRLYEIFDSNAFEISIPDTWAAQEVFYPFSWVKQLALKDTLSKGYFKIGQYVIINNSSKFSLKDDVINVRVKNLKKARYRKFTSTVLKKKSSFDEHYVLNTSWRNWRDKKSILKHTTEYLQKDNIVYVFRYSDSTYSAPSFNKDVQSIISSFKEKRKPKVDLNIFTITKPTFQVKFIKGWEITNVKGYGFLNSIVFYKKGKRDAPSFQVESDFFKLKKEMSLKELEAVIIEKDEFLKNFQTLKSRVTNNFIELTGVWNYNGDKRKKTIRYYKKGKAIFKAVYGNSVAFFDKYNKEKKLFFGSLKFKEL